MSERANLRAQRAKIRPDGQRGGTEGRKDGRTDVSKFPPVSYRTLVLWGRCPKRVIVLKAGP